jgi:hypothetical protein
LGRGYFKIYAWVDWVTHEHDLLGIRHRGPQEFQPLGVQLDGHEADARQVAAWVGHAGSEFGYNRVAAEAIHDRNVRDLADTEDGSALGDDHVGLETDNLVHDAREALRIAIG